MVMDFDLDFEKNVKQAEDESRCGARLVISEYKIQQVEDRQHPGMMREQVTWYQEWKRLDRNLDFNYKNRLLMPDPTRETFSRRRMQYFQCLEAFAQMGYKGRKPDDFLNIECVIEETSTGRGGFTWWKPIAKYQEGQTIDEALGIVSTEAVTMEPPATNHQSDEATETAEIFDTGNESWDLILSGSIGRGHSAAVRFISRMEEIKSNEELMANIKSGQIFEELIENGYLVEEDGTYVKGEKLTTT